MHTRRAIFFASALAMLLARSVSAQVLRMLGEMEVQVKNPVTDKVITANASANVVGGTWREWYPVTHNYDYRSQTASTFRLDCLDREYPPGTDNRYFARGLYRITIDGNSIDLDYRDADYEDGNGQFGTGYNTADMTVYYNCADGCFYRYPGLQERDRIYGGWAIWEGGRKNPAVAKIPVTVTNNIGGEQLGQVVEGGSTYNVPRQVKWTLNSTNTIEAISPQTLNSLVYQFTSWSGGGDQSRQVVASFDEFSTVFTANFSVARPVRVTNFWVSGTAGEHPHLTWDEHPNADVNYYVYRKIRHNGVVGPEVLVSTLSHSTTSFDDLEYTIVGHSSDLLFYDARAHHVPSNTFAESWFLGGLYGESLERTSPDVAGAVMDAGECAEMSMFCYPNPFNPVAQITYRLNEPSSVRLVVYDVLGRQVAELVNGQKGGGDYTVSWDGSELGSGVYVARIDIMTASGQPFSHSQKMLLAK